MQPTVPLYNLEGKEIEKVALDPEVFDGEVNTELLYQIKLMYEANLRSGTASTKTRGEVRGGGRKPWKQKGTGRARAGSIRSPLWPGGGKTFGPRPRDYSYRFPKKVMRIALKNCLNMRLKEKALKLTQEIKVEKPNTKIFAGLLKNLNITANALIVTKDRDHSIELASRNIPNIMVKYAHDVNVLDILRSRQLILTRLALEELIGRIKR